MRIKPGKILLILSVVVLFTSEGCKEEENSFVLTNEATFPKNLSVTLNPNGITPLSAIAKFNTGVPVKIAVSVMGPKPISYITGTYAQQHEVGIHGLYPDTLNRVKISMIDQHNNMVERYVEIETEPVYNGFPKIEINTNLQGDLNTDLYLCDLHLGNSGYFTSYPIIFDSDGEIRWCMDLRAFKRITWPVHQSSLGTLIFGNVNGIYEYDLLGNTVNQWTIPGYSAHHEVTEMPNGNLLVAVARSGATITVNGSSIPSVDDHIIEMDRNSGMILSEWDLRKYLDVDRTALADVEGDWFHMNGIAYSETDDCLIVSGRNQALVKITRNNELVWIMAPHMGWEEGGADGNGAPTQPFLLTAVNTFGQDYSPNLQMGISNTNSFDWPWGQHAPEILEDGRILMFDNGYNRLFGNSNNYSRAVMYNVNESNMTVSQSWDYGKELGESGYSAIISNAYFYAENQSVLFCAGYVYGTEARIIEVDYSSKIPQFDARLVFKNLTSSGNPGWGTIDILYRTHKFSF